MATCYICRRTEDDMEFMIESSVEQLQKVLEHEQEALEQVLQEHEQTYSGGIPVLEGVDLKYRAMAVKTIAGDLKAFRELIPNVEVVLEECKTVPHYTVDKTINELIEGTRPENNSRAMSLRQKIADIESRREALVENGVRFQTKEMRVRDAYRGMDIPLPPGLQQTRIMVTLCPVCHGLVSEVAGQLLSGHAGSGH